jgi:hypothetical protein
MHPTTGNTPPGRARPGQRRLTRARLQHAAPVVAIAGYGVLWIALSTGGGRSTAHTLWQSLALAETSLALLLRARKPVASLASILAVYLLFGLGPLLLPAVLFALFTVAATRDHRTVAIASGATAAALAAVPYIHGDAVSFTRYSLPRLAAAGAAVAAGTYLQARRHRRSPTALAGYDAEALSDRADYLPCAPHRRSERHQPSLTGRTTLPIFCCVST